MEEVSTVLQQRGFAAWTISDALDAAIKSLQDQGSNVGLTLGLTLDAASKVLQQQQQGADANLILARVLDSKQTVFDGIPETDIPAVEALRTTLVELAEVMAEEQHPASKVPGLFLMIGLEITSDYFKQELQDSFSLGLAGILDNVTTLMREQGNIGASLTLLTDENGSLSWLIEQGSGLTGLALQTALNASSNWLMEQGSGVGNVGLALADILKEASSQLGRFAVRVYDMTLNTLKYILDRADTEFTRLLGNEETEKMTIGDIVNQLLQETSGNVGGIKVKEVVDLVIEFLTLAAGSDLVGPGNVNALVDALAEASNVLQQQANGADLTLADALDALITTIVTILNN
jgi:hypothetical protein